MEAGARCRVEGGLSAGARRVSGLEAYGFPLGATVQIGTGATREAADAAAA